MAAEEGGGVLQHGRQGRYGKRRRYRMDLGRAEGRVRREQEAKTSVIEDDEVAVGLLKQKWPSET